MKVQIVNNVELTKVYIDGHDVSQRLTKVNVELDAECYPVVKLELLPDEIEVEGDFEVLKKLPEEKKNKETISFNIGSIKGEVDTEKFIKEIAAHFEKALREVSES